MVVPIVEEVSTTRKWPDVPVAPSILVRRGATNTLASLLVGRDGIIVIADVKAESGYVDAVVNPKEESTKDWLSNNI